jgi:Leucine-rich repeat (LRR) protein
LYSGGLTDANFAGLNNLNYLEISGNSFGESMPNVLSQLNSLEQIFVEDSAITGGLDFMIGMPLIFQCWIDKNPAFGGTIPSEIGDLSTLASWSITENSFSGTIPTELGKLTNMQRLWMYGNDLTGNVPSEFGSIIKLELLRLEENNFSGTMPDEVCNLRNDFLSSLAILGSVCGIGFAQCTCCDCCDIAECDAL